MFPLGNEAGTLSVEQQLFDCEVAGLVVRYRREGAEAVKRFLLLVEKHRGTDAANRLRFSVWEKLKEGKK